MIKPSISCFKIISAISSHSCLFKSGAIFKSSGDLEFTENSSLRVLSFRSRSSSASLPCKARNPGVFGEETLMVK